MIYALILIPIIGLALIGLVSEFIYFDGSTQYRDRGRR